jgi:DNA-binding transcriptional MerR regulator
MTIGEFSSRSQLSLKALRLYERLGLLRPVAVDPGNGYRRYHESQLYTARLIIMLRLLDMPLSEVGRVVSASGAEAAELIDAYWGSVETRFTAQRQVMASLRPGVAVSEMPAPELLVRERDVAEQTVLSEQRHVYVGQLAWIREAAARLTATAARCGGVAGERSSSSTASSPPTAMARSKCAFLSGTRPKTRLSWPGELKPHTGKPSSR